MKKHGYTVLITGIMLAGIALLTYPWVSEMWNRMVQTQVIDRYEQTLKNMPEDTVEKQFAAAQQYNKQLETIAFPFMNFGQIEGYEEIFNIDGDGTMGYLDIEKIRVHLPIRHGTGADVLNDSVGHLKGSSLPTGGPGVHTVLSAHRGLPSARLFTDLDRLETGDTFTLTILDRTFRYEVDAISVVTPEQVDPLYPVPEKDYCTLLTCTPYGINTHRLLVRGKRIG